MDTQDRRDQELEAEEPRACTCGCAEVREGEPPEDGQPRECHCLERSKQRSEAEYRSLINRLNRIEGQVRGIRRMVERGAYCPDILMQSAAVNAAVNAFNRELLASHLHSCVVHDIREGKDEVIDELVITLQKLMK